MFKLFLYRARFALASRTLRTVNWWATHHVLINWSAAAFSWVVSGWYGFPLLLRLIVTVPMIFLPTFIAVGLALAVEPISRRFLSSYVRHCSRLNLKPTIPFVLFLRPFASDYSYRFYYESTRVPSPDPPESIGTRDRSGRPMGNDVHSIVGLEKILGSIAESFGAWLQIDTAATSDNGYYGTALEGADWRTFVATLCDHARFIFILPLFDVDLADTKPPTWKEARYVPVPEIVRRALTERSREGLHYEISLVSRASVLTKTIIVVPERVNMSEWKTICTKLEDVGITLPPIRWSEPRHRQASLSFYRCRGLGQTAQGIEVNVTNGTLDTAFWSIEETRRLFVANPVEYLLEDDDSVRDRYER